MSDDYPFRPDGSGDEAHFHQKVHGHTFGPGSKLRNSSTVKWHKTADGIFATVKVPRSNGGSDISVYQVQSVPSGTDDYFSAMAYDFTDDSTSGDAVNIALPWELRNAQMPSGSSISPAYAVDDIVFVLETDDGENGVTVSGTELGLMDLGLGRTWSVGGGTVISAFTISTLVNGDYWVCTPVGGGSSVNVAKPYKLRNSITSASIDGNSWTYAYTNTVERTATSGSYSEYQRISPRVLAGDLIFAYLTTAAQTGVTSVLWQDLNVNGCAWTANVDETAP